VRRLKAQQRSGGAAFSLLARTPSGETWRTWRGRLEYPRASGSACAVPAFAKSGCEAAGRQHTSLLCCSTPHFRAAASPHTSASGDPGFWTRGYASRWAKRHVQGYADLEFYADCSITVQESYEAVARRTRPRLFGFLISPHRSVPDAHRTHCHYQRPGTRQTCSLVRPEHFAECPQTPFVSRPPGSGGNIAAEYVARATPDGYTLLVAADPVFAINHTCTRSSPSTAQDLVPVSTLMSQPFP